MESFIHYMKEYVTFRSPSIDFYFYSLEKKSILSQNAEAFL